MAEGVEKVGAVRVFAIIVRVSRTYSNVASIKPRTLYHYFKKFELRDFFNSLSHNRKSHAHLRRIDFRVAVRYSRLITFVQFKLRSKPDGLRKNTFGE